jgi:hypothetical protein
MESIRTFHFWSKDNYLYYIGLLFTLTIFDAVLIPAIQYEFGYPVPNVI